VLDAEERRLRVRAAIKRLPAPQRDVIRLHKLEGWPMAMIARRLGVGRVTLRVRAHRGYTMLREHAKRYCIDVLAPRDDARVHGSVTTRKRQTERTSTRH
jgi:DNA-directed RNA polymerase specialized sigma24 family protein